MSETLIFVTINVRSLSGRREGGGCPGVRVFRCAGTPQPLVFYVKQRVWARSCALTKLIMLSLSST